MRWLRGLWREYREMWRDSPQFAIPFTVICVNTAIIAVLTGVLVWAKLFR